MSFHEEDDEINLKDFESLSDGSEEIKENENKDSFHNNLDKLYEDHKKFQTKSSEVQNTNRPISSYARIVSASSRADETPLNVPNLIQRLNNFLDTNNISQNSMFENAETFLDMNEFKNIFKWIGFELSKNELSYLFSTNNPNFNEGYIQGKVFLKNFEGQIEFKKLNQSEYAYEQENREKLKDQEKENKYIGKNKIHEQSEEIFDSFTNNNLLNKDTKTSNNYYNNLNFLSNQKSNFIDELEEGERNQETNTNNKLNSIIKNNFLSDSQNNNFKNIENEVFKILISQEKKDLEQKKKKLMSARIPKKNIPQDDFKNQFTNKQKLAPLTAKNNKRSTTGQKIQSAVQIENRPNTSIIPFSNQKKKSLKKSPKQYMIETLRKKDAEEELIKLALEKRNKEFERDCIVKMNEANEICETIKIPLSFSVFISEEVNF